MLSIYPITLLVAADAARIARLIEIFDRDMARQCRKAGGSVPLNTAEGSGSRGGNRRARYENALGSSRELHAIYDASVAMQYIEEPGEEVRGRLNRVIATYVSLLYKK